MTKNQCLQFGSVTWWCLTLCDPMDCGTPGFPVSITNSSSRKWRHGNKRGEMGYFHTSKWPQEKTYHLSTINAWISWWVDIWGGCVLTKILLFYWSLCILGLFPGGSDGKASAYNAGDLGWIPRSGKSPGEGNSNPLLYSCLENPMDGGV